MSVGELAEVAFQTVAAAVVGWAVGDVVARRVLLPGFGLAERALAALFGLVVFSVAGMVAHVATGGFVFETPGVVAGAAVLVVARAWRRARPRAVPWRAVGVAVALLGALYAGPVVAGGSSLRGGDTPWHMGRTNQLLGGRLVPGGPAAGFDRNAYPWGFHAILATVVRIAPGTSVESALASTSFLIALALPLGAACVARLADRRAGWAAAACAALIGGFGWIQAGEPVFFTSPDDARHGADLVTASPNGVYALLPPALPRELGLALLAFATVAVVGAVVRPERTRALGAGACLGLVGLVSVPLLANGLAWAAALVIALGRRRLATGIALACGAGAVFALWAAPVALDYLRFGGFVNVAPVLGREWPLGTALGAWGVLGPLAAGGVAVCTGAGGRCARALPVLAAAAAAMWAVAVARGAFDWDVAGVPWLLHQGRMWPPAHLLAAALGGVAVTWGYARLRARSPIVAAAGAVVLFGVAAVSPLLASLALTETIAAGRGGFAYTGRDFEPDGFIARAAAHLGPDDVVAIEGSRALDLLLFQFSGVRVANFEDGRLTANDVRIRYSDLARRWDHRIANGGFAADYAAVPEERAGRGDEVIARGDFDGATFLLVRR